MRGIIASKKFQESKFALPIALGRTISNETYTFDLAKMPHLLVAGFVVFFDVSDLCFFQQVVAAVHFNTEGIQSIDYFCCFSDDGFVFIGKTWNNPLPVSHNWPVL